MNAPLLSPPERSTLTLGLIPLVDAAPLVVAQAAGHFRRHGLDVGLSREASWASIRDKLATGLIDGAHMLAPMPLAANLGLDPLRTPVIAAAALNLGGSSVCVSNALYKRLRECGANEHSDPLGWAQALRRVVEEDRGSRPPLTLAHVFPWSTHHYELRYWLASAGLHPDRDLNLVTVPPPRMVEQLESGRIDGCCVGSPWPELAEARGAGRVLFGKDAFWSGGPEKVLGVTQAWAETYPATLQALIAALIEAGRWLDDPANHLQAARWMAEGGFIDAEPALIAACLPRLRFHSGAASFPWRSQALWLLAQMRRWHHIGDDVDLRAVAAASYRPDLYRQAAAALGEPLPRHDEKPEGREGQDYRVAGVSGELVLRADRLFDGQAFDPAALAP